MGVAAGSTTADKTATLAGGNDSSSGAGLASGARHAMFIISSAEQRAMNRAIDLDHIEVSAGGLRLSCRPDELPLKDDQGHVVKLRRLPGVFANVRGNPVDDL